MLDSLNKLKSPKVDDETFGVVDEEESSNDEEESEKAEDDKSSKSSSKSEAYVYIMIAIIIWVNGILKIGKLSID